MTNHPKILLVEGRHEVLTVPEILEANGVAWGTPPIRMEDSGGAEQILRAGYIEAVVKASGRQAVGVLIDADADPAARWASIRNRCEFNPLPDEPVPGGFSCSVVVAGRHVRFGVWLTPDNQSVGMFEDLLIPLFRPEHAELHAHVDEFVDHGKALGAGFRPSHRSKARLASWLALETPGEPMWRAALQRKLSLDHPRLTPFVAWARALFDV